MINKKEIVKAIAASLLGDGSIYREGNKNGNFRMSQISIHLDHLTYIGNILSDLTKVDIKQVRKEKVDVVIDGKKTVSNPYHTLRTMNHPLYTKFRQRVYPNGHKVVDPHYLTLLDWEFLAIWYMQDGMLEPKREDTINCGAAICTDNFSYGDCVLLRQALIEKLNLTWNIRPKSTNKQGNRTYRMHLYRKQFDYFEENIRKYIQPSFLYKIERREYNSCTKIQSDLSSDIERIAEMTIPSIASNNNDQMDYVIQPFIS